MRPSSGARKFGRAGTAKQIVRNMKIGKYFGNLGLKSGIEKWKQTWKHPWISELTNRRPEIGPSSGDRKFGRAGAAEEIVMNMKIGKIWTKKTLEIEQKSIV